MSGIHTGCKQGTRVKLLFKDGRPAVIEKFKEEKGRYIHTYKNKYPIKDLRSMMIYKPTNQ